MKLAWDRRRLFYFFSDKLLNFSINPWVEMDAHGKCTVCIQGLPGPPGAHVRGALLGPAPGVGMAWKMPVGRELLPVTRPSRLGGASWNFWQPALGAVQVSGSLEGRRPG